MCTHSKAAVHTSSTFASENLTAGVFGLAGKSHDLPSLFIRTHLVIKVIPAYHTHAGGSCLGIRRARVKQREAQVDEASSPSEGGSRTREEPDSQRFRGTVAAQRLQDVTNTFGSCASLPPQTHVRHDRDTVASLAVHS